MKVIWRLIKVFLISIITLYIISNFPGLDFIYNVFNVTENSTKEAIVASISTLAVGIVFELIPFLFKKYVADKIKITVTYLNKNTPVRKLQFKTEVNSQGQEEYKKEIIKIDFSLDEGTSMGYWMLKQLNAKIILKYNPQQFSTIKKDGSIIENNTNEELLSRDSKGYIYINIFNGFSSVGDFSIDTEIYIKPKYAHINRSDLVIKVQTSNWFTSLLARGCTEVINGKLILKRWEE